MIPIEFEGTNRRFVLQGCSDLPAKVEEIEVEGLGKVPTISTVWALNTEEIINVMNSGKIRFTLIGTEHPPILLEVVNE